MPIDFAVKFVKSSVDIILTLTFLYSFVYLKIYVIKIYED